MTVRTENLVIRMSTEEMGYIKKVADLLNTPVSTLAREELMRIFGPYRADGVINLEDGTLVYRKDHPEVVKTKKVNKMDAQRTMREEIREMQERLGRMELELVIQEQEIT